MSKKCAPLWRGKIDRSQTTQNKPAPDHFWKLTCRKSAGGCGARHIFQAKMLKTLLDVQILFRVASARDCASCQKLPQRESFEKKTATTTTPPCTPFHYTYCCATLHYITIVTPHDNYTTVQEFHNTTLHLATLHYTTLNYTTSYTTLITSTSKTTAT